MAISIDDVTAALTSAISGPQTVSGDAGSVTQFPVESQIKAYNYLLGLAAANTRNKGLRFNQLVPGGTVRLRPYGTEVGGTGWYGFGGRTQF